MATNQLSIDNVINISVVTPGAGLLPWNTSNLALFTHDTCSNSGVVSAGYGIYLDPVSVAADWGTTSTTTLMAQAVFAQQPNILAGNGALVIIPFSGSGETLDVAISRTTSLVQYFGIISSQLETITEGTSTTGLMAATAVQGMNKLLFLVDNVSSAVSTGGFLDLLRSSGLTQTRGLLYLDTTVGGTGGLAPINALTMMAAYAGRALSTNFNGSNTTQTMHLKSLASIQPDPAITQTNLTAAIAAGADTYPSIQGVAKVFCSGANDYFDNQYNLQAFVGSLQVAGFNALAQVGTKLPQTEQGMAILKGAYLQVCQQFVNNQFLAPGAWTSGTTFGNQALMLASIAANGYYMYSAPISQQLPAVRVTRAAPLVQIACKYAGALQSSDVIVYVNP